MRNFRKTRKRGGMSVSTVLECVAPYDTITKCSNEFVRRENFIVVEVPGDGNCMYHTLSKYFELSGRRPVPTHRQLRQTVVDEIDRNLNTAKNSIIINTSNIPANISEEDRKTIEEAKYIEAVEELREDGVWNSDNADLVSQFAANALNLTVKIYDRRAAREAEKRLMSKMANGTKVYRNYPAEPAKIICYTFEPSDGPPVGTVNMFRVSNSHYKLLYPKDAGVAPKGRRVTAKKANGAAGKPTIINNTVAKMAAMKLNNKRVTNKKPNAAVGPMTRSRTRANKSRSPSPTLQRALKEIAAMEAKEAVAAKKAEAAAKRAEAAAKRATATKGSVRTASLENALMKIALQESEESSKKKKQLNNNFFAALNMASFEPK